MGDGIGQFNEAPLIEEKHESSMRLPSLPAASSASQVLLAAGRAFAGVSCTYECWINQELVDLKHVGCARIAVIEDHRRGQHGRTPCDDIVSRPTMSSQGCRCTSDDVF